jgi:hypothetical protein
MPHTLRLLMPPFFPILTFNEQKPGVSGRVDVTGPFPSVIEKNKSRETLTLIPLCVIIKSDLGYQD